MLNTYPNIIWIPMRRTKIRMLKTLMQIAEVGLVKKEVRP